MKQYLKNIFMNFIVIFLLVFMLGIFGPTEIFFGNYKELGFVFSEFGWIFLGCGIGLSAVLAFILLLMPKIITKVVEILLFATSVGCYIQVMFLNKSSDMIGATAEGYTATKIEIVKNAIVWILLFGLIICISIWLKNSWKKFVVIGSTVLLGIQLCAYVSLFFMASEEAFTYKENEKQLSGQYQYTVSTKENIIILLLDNFSSTWLEVALRTYPDLLEDFPDFTYYDNANCDYYSTYPSLTRLVTGNEFDPELTVNEYTYQSWSNDRTEKYYDLLHDNGYSVNVYTSDPSILVGGNSMDIIGNKIDNLVTGNDMREINHELMVKTLLNMSLYRYVPNGCKNFFDVGMEAYAKIVLYPENSILSFNSDFYNTLVKEGLQTVDDRNMYQFYHLTGTHEFKNDENCEYSENATMEQTIKGIFVMLKEYIKQLKEVGAYDNSTIIITTDHGVAENMQAIFFIKNKNEKHEELKRNTSPISLNDMMSTIVQCIGEDYTVFGKSIYDFEENEERERYVYERNYDANYPAVERYDGNTASQNVYYLYTYTGDLSEYQNKYFNHEFVVIPMVDSYF